MARGNNLTDLLDRSKGVGDEAKKLQASTAILTRMVPDFDQTIGSGAPKYQLIWTNTGSARRR